MWKRIGALAVGMTMILASGGLWMARGRGLPGGSPARATWVYSAEAVERTSEPILPIPFDLHLDERKVELGRRLFVEKRLSHNNTLSCASCHSLSKGGADGMDFSVGSGGQVGTRNTPTVLNVAFNFRQFWDGRANTLEDQIDGPLLNPKEMASSWAEVAGKLAQDPQYILEFRAIYPEGIRTETIKEAIAMYERSLITPNCRFDRYLRGDASALTEAEMKGYQIFKRRGCVSCHQGINIGGNLFAQFGAMEDVVPNPDAEASIDTGRYPVTHRVEDRNVFKVPSLRNVALTGPYFHDGSVGSLKDVVSIMAQYQLGLDMRTEEVNFVVAFLKTLTGEVKQNKR